MGLTKSSWPKAIKLSEKKEDPLRARCDSYVLETDVHFPTDLNLLWDVVRTVVILTARYATKTDLSGWRQWQYNLRQLKNSYRRVQTLRHSTSKTADKKIQRQQEIHEACQSYLNASQSLIYKAEVTLKNKVFASTCPTAKIAYIQQFIVDGKRQMDQIKRRVLDDEKIPHSEKVFSLFQPHTEWICKGKAGVPVKLGVRLVIVEDQYGFILNHRLMEKETDEKAAVPIIQSAINALEAHGLDKCPDHGIKGLKRYVALGILARNIQKVGAELQKLERKKAKKSKLRLCG